MRTMKKKNPVGRPPKYKTPEELENVIDDYFDSLIGEDGEWVRPPTVTGLARRLNLSRQGLLNYKKKDEFIDTIMHARARVEEFNEESLFSAGKSTTGVMFNLKNNFGWEDKTKHDVSTDEGFDERLIAAKRRMGLIGERDEWL